VVGLRLLLKSCLRDPLAVWAESLDRGPEVHLLRRLVLGLRDDHRLNLLVFDFDLLVFLIGWPATRVPRRQTARRME
jgi:hypothetical protein